MAVGAARLPTLVREHVGAIPLFWTDAAGTFAAGLVFRVGRADETLPLAGITHLVEHLAMPTRRPRGVECNACVTGIFTTFWAAGEPDAALSFVEETAAALQDLPLERLETERTVLLTEAESAPPSAVGAAAALRFGPIGHGLIGYEELGLHRIEREHVVSWAAERFGAASAAIYTTGPPPRELDVQLPVGQRLPVSAPDPIGDLRFPARYGHAPPGGVAVAFVGPRSAPLAVALAVAEERVRARVRSELGLSYHVEVVWEPLTAEHGHGVLVCDCRMGSEAAVADAVLSVLAQLAADGPTLEELDRDLEGFGRQVSDPSNAAARLWYHATWELLGAPVPTDDELLRERHSVSPGAAGEALEAALSTALLLGTEDVAADGCASYPMHSVESVAGRAHRPRGLPLLRGGPRLVVGEDGVTVVDADGNPATVSYDACVAAQRWPDGTRVLRGRDGTCVVVEPSVWRRGQAAVEQIDGRLPAEVVVPMERELEARVGAVESALGGTVKRGWLTSEELDLLPHVIEQGESVITGSRASKGWRLGVLAVTDRRVLFLYCSTVVVDLPLGEIDAVESIAGRWLCDDRLIVSMPGERCVFSDVAHVDGVAAAIRERLRRAGAH